MKQIFVHYVNLLKDRAYRYELFVSYGNESNNFITHKIIIIVQNTNENILQYAGINYYSLFGI